MGSATAWPLSDNGHSVHLVGTHLDGWIIDECKQRRYHPKLKRQLPDRVTPYYVDEMGEALQVFGGPGEFRGDDDFSFNGGDESRGGESRRRNVFRIFERGADHTDRAELPASLHDDGP